MMTVEETLARILALCAPLDAETIPLAQAHGRVLAESVSARQDQPPFDASAMDGYAVCSPVAVGDSLRLREGSSAAGHGFNARIERGEALRILTGAPLPEGADRVVIQEDVTLEDGKITIRPDLSAGFSVRKRGEDFRAGDTLSAPRRLRPVELGLIAAMGHGEIRATRRPKVALIATGDELVAPGTLPGPDQITASSVVALKGLCEAEGAEARILPIARDTEAALKAAFALAEGADVIIATGGASVGDHDLLRPTALALGAELAFHKIAMRPGKPMMAGKLQDALFFGLPGNPVSTLVCAHLFLLPALRALSGLGAWPAPSFEAWLACDVPANGKRAHYMRATLEPDGKIRPLAMQDSSYLSFLAKADALLIRPINDPARSEGEAVRYLPI